MCNPGLDEETPEAATGMLVDYEERPSVFETFSTPRRFPGQQAVAREVAELLKLHYFRSMFHVETSRNNESAATFLYGVNDRNRTLRSQVTVFPHAWKSQNLGWSMPTTSMLT